jgi:hypothetical protein
MDPSSYNLFGDDYYLWNVRAYDISGNYSQGMKLDPSSNFAFRRNGSTIATLGSNLITPSTSSLYDGLNVSGTYFSNSVSAIQIPADTSANRPAGQAGYMRYNTTTNVIEYWNAASSSWTAIAEPSPIITGVSPTYFNVGASNSFNLTGSNFSSVGVSIVAIGTNGSGTIVTPTVSTYVSQNSATVLFDVSATHFLTDASNQLPFALRLTNNNSGFSSLLQNSIISANVGPVVVQPNPQTIPFQTFPVQDPCANFTILGLDPAPTHYPFQSIAITSGTAGNINSVSFNSAIDISSARVTVPSGQRSSATAGTYPFTVQIVDGSGGIGTTTLNLALADPVVTSAVPNTVDSSFNYDLSLNGNYFVVDSSVNYVNQSTGAVVPTTTTYSSITQLKTNVTFPVNNTSSNIIYDVSLNNGTVFKLYTSVVTVLTRLVNFSYTQISGTTLTPSISYENSSKAFVSNTTPQPGGYTVVSFVPTPTDTDYTQNYQWNISFSKTITLTEILVVGGGGAGANDTNNTNGNGGGGAGGFRETTAVGPFTASTTYLVQCGRPGQLNIGGAQSTANGQTIINTTPTGPSPSQSSYASGISTGSTNIYVASGGGNGGYYSANIGGSGGSGGGGAADGAAGGSGNLGGFTEGTSGASGGSGQGGGGGGALTGGSGRTGGNGKTSTYFSSYFGAACAGGGGGTGGGTYGNGGTGGGGAARANPTSITTYSSGFWGVPGTGGGGGASDKYPSSAGGSGRVQFRFLSFIP